MTDTPKNYELIEKEINDILESAPRPMHLTQQKIESLQKETNELASNLGSHNNEKTLANIANVLLQQFSQYQRENALVIEAHKKAIKLAIEELKKQ